jgi:DNA polymerase-3 subunit alpha
LADLSAGLILLTGGTQGPLARLLAEGQQPEAERLLARFAEAFADRTVMELHRHGLAVEKAIEPGLIALADAARVPLVATNECFFAKPSMYEAHDALLCIAEGRLLSERERRRVTPEHWFKPAAAMRALFADLPEACDNTLAIARRCAVMAETRKPQLPVCPKVRPGSSEDETLRAMAGEGLERRLAAMQSDEPTRQHYRERLAYELDIIARMDFPGYFLIVADFIQWAKSQDIPVGPGRGRLGGCLGADDHRSRPYPIRSVVRAFPQSRAGVDARLRHRFLSGAARRGHRLCPPRIRRRSRGADHHFRKVAGPRGGA